MTGDGSAGGEPFSRAPLPKRFCNLERLLFALGVRGLDGIVATLPYNVFYLTGFNAIAHNVHVTKDGGRPLFSWGFEPLVAWSRSRRPCAMQRMRRTMGRACCRCSAG